MTTQLHERPLTAAVVENAGTEFFVAYTSQSPFRELMVIALLMPVIIAVVPDRAANPPPS
jgi:hypothetical protein